ncbi:UDP-3-O-(3-hydroxymyristoyl) glucosamine N-acyltransferase [Neosynechococcus sphagnicola sy1]|uniref:UDP-3-O-acylglucosamine N-acyltransferase n=2 Tax=Neosynechococcus TaxID=1501143 RepID=A0A098TGI3_9CYAN|nr:UDP-3-O-(3-hydroxymyristoyl)glucosamine N-acyltransferase [Neosynechococcus sphagnicola]KGF71685.1 UDP-3-O-(3-hydroxymyristoyl) glucosamine N-acyltransferase [Neosynechococcus sphagnicola sy1]
MKFSELVQRLAVESHSLLCSSAIDPDLLGVAAIEEATPGTLSYIEGEKFAAQVQTTAAAALILPPNPVLQTQATDRGIAWMTAVNPRLVFAQAIAQFYQPYQPIPGIHSTAVIDPSAVIGEAVAIGAHVVIAAGVQIGAHVCIHPNVVIYPAAQIGDRTILHANCVIHERTRIGADCVIQSGAVIGAEGFGFVPIPEGWFKMPQSGYVVLEAGVEVGCNSTIDRPAVGRTRIAHQTKLDNLVHIGHGCQIGENCALAAQVGLAGGVIVGDRVILAGQVGISNQVRVGKGAIASAKTGIHSDVEPGAVISGYPGIPNKLWLKSVAIFNRLPEIYQSLRRIQRHLDLTE